MKFHKLGPHSKVSSFCFGCEPLGGVDWGNVNEKGIIESVELAYARNVNFFDTALVYGLGKSEKKLSLALGQNRFDCIIATKGGLSWGNKKLKSRTNVFKDFSKRALEQNLYLSLKNLDIENIPLYYIHYPSSNLDEVKRVFNLFESFKEKGLITSIGCSNFNYYQLQAACSVSKIDVIQIRDNILLKQNNKLITMCKEKKIPIASYNVLNRGLLTGKYDLDHKFKKTDRRSRYTFDEDIDVGYFQKKFIRMKEDAKKRNVNVAELVIKAQHRKLMRKFSIIGIKNKSQLESALRAYN